MRRFQKQSRPVRCAVRIDVERNMEEGPLSSSSDLETRAETYAPFRDVVKSAHALAMIRETLAVLFGASAPLIASIAADADKQLLHIEVSGGQNGAEQVRAACAMIRTIEGASGGGDARRVLVRCCVQQVTVQ